MKKGFCIITIMLVLLTDLAHANKVAAVQTIIRKECGKLVSPEEAQYWVRALFLSCIPNTDVKIEEQCTLKCLKTDYVNRP
ncbi:hypothetical protein [Bdellovibrio sp. HCB2-146]|uniref:hypothetical protein n=1 Tax=Bdellovibrio sp. HCB2-146 TaxID=3394362 RepID=UPI0039BCBCE4